MNITVMKFGGTSVGSADALSQCADIIKSYIDKKQAVAVVISAMSGVTDTLIESAHNAAAGDERFFREKAAIMRSRHLDTLKEITNGTSEKSVEEIISENIEEFLTLCHAVHVLGEATPRALDAIIALGERMSIPLLSARLNHIGVAAKPVDSRSFLITDHHHQAANPDVKTTRKNAQKLLIPLLKKNTVPVITGFLGSTPEGATTTLGRGGSDFSASLVGNVLNAQKVIIWTDVTGVMSTDPRIVPQARTIPKLMYREVAELAYFGAKVLHPKCIRPAVENGGELWVKNTFAPEEAGTQIVQDESGTKGLIRAVTKIPNLSLITIAGTGMLGVPGVAARAFATTARAQANVLMISQASSEQSISFLIPASDAEKVVSELETAFADELHQRDIDAINHTEDVVIITAVGTGMRETPGVAGRIFTALGQDKINVIAIAQGSSECGISFVVAAKDAKDGVRCVHRLTS